LNLTISQFPRKTVQDTDLFIVAQTVGLGGNYAVSLPINAMLADIAANTASIGTLGTDKADLVAGLVPVDELPIGSASARGAVQVDNVTIVADSAGVISLSGTGTVISVNGRSGAVVLTKADVGLSNVPNVDTTDATNIAVGTLNVARLPTQVTLEGNNFNGANQLVKLNSSTQLPAIDGSLLTNLNGSVITTGLIPITVIPNTVTKLGNAVNGPNQLVMLDGAARYPALNSGITVVTDPTTSSLSSLDSALANIFGSGSVSTVSVVATHGFSGVVANPTSTPAITLSTTVTGIIKGSAGSLVAASVSDFPILNQNTTGNAATASNLLGGVVGSIAYQTSVDVTSFIAPVANAVLITNGSGVPLLSNTLPTVNGSALTNLNASNIATGNLAIARLPGGGVNGANQLVQLDSSGNLPALDASSLTNLSAANITGSIPTANLAKATTSAFGVVQVGSNIDVSAGVISVPAATVAALGVVQPDGITITIAGGLLVASAASSAVNITGGTTGSIPYQTGAGTTGFISPANNSILVTNGSGTPSLSNTLPAVDGSAITNLTAANVDPASGPLPYQVLPLATSLQAGAVIAGTNISISSGTISVATAGATFGSAGSLGVAAGDGVTITVNSSGIMTASAASNVGGGAAGDLLYQSGANTTSFITSANGVLVGNGGTPAYTTTPTLTGTNFSGIPNSATTATNANTASAIVARDVNGDFSAGTITANLTGTASGNQVLKPLAVAANFATWDGAGQTVDSGLSLNTSTSLVGAANTNIPSTLAIKTYVDNAVTGGLNIIGSWDASTNTPTLTAGIGVQGNAYICNVAGTQTLPSGSPVAYYVGDVLFYSAGGIWDVIPAGNTVVSVNGQQGVVSLGLANMNDATITGPTAAQLLVYNGTASKWENVDLTG
jgi:hypothetical protein